MTDWVFNQSLSGKSDARSKPEMENLEDYKKNDTTEDVLIKVVWLFEGDFRKHKARCWSDVAQVFWKTG